MEPNLKIAELEFSNYALESNLKIASIYQNLLKRLI